jgi:hypothetical protein
MPRYAHSLLEAALVGYQARKAKIDGAMAAIKEQLKGTGRPAQLDGGGGDIPTPFAKLRKKRRMSAAARKRIAAAQRKRWAEYHKNNGQ